MPYAAAKDGTRLFYKDWGSGPPVVLVHGWPLNADMWEFNQPALTEAGFRTVSYDRRGFGRSDQPWTGYDYDTFADDLAALMDELDLTGATLVGFSMGGGEVVRYLARHGATRVAKAVLIGAVPPFLLQTTDNPDGAPMAQFDGIIAGLKADRPKFLAGFGKGFFGASLLKKPVSDEVQQWALNLALMASPAATTACVTAFGTTDFRADMAAVTVPTLIIHGTGDDIVPIKISGHRQHEMIAGSRLIEYDGAPHGLFATEAERLNADLLDFLRT